MIIIIDYNKKTCYNNFFSLASKMRVNFNLCGCTITYLGIKMCLQQTVPNQDFDRIISLQQCDERLCSMQWVSFGVVAHLEVIWLDLEKDYQDFEVFCEATEGNHLLHICRRIVRLCLTLRIVLNEQS